MLIVPILCVAILARHWRWSELATLIAAFAALAAKDPLVVLARQRFIWRQPHPETAAAARWLAGWLTLLALSGIVLLLTWPPKATLAMALSVGAFSALAIFVNVKNRQRSTLFQILSAAALTSGALATSLSATGTVPVWAWWLWLLLAMQASTGILVVHARLDARIAARIAASTAASIPPNHTLPPPTAIYRRAALIAISVLAAAAIAAASLRHPAIALALLLAVVGYSYDLRSQRDPVSIQMPLQRVGQRALTLSSLVAILLIVGFW
jgi:4-hydroxybenzoate polyprenyltransferase